MPRLDPLRAEAVPELEDLLEAAKNRMGFLPNSQLILAWRPEILRAFQQLGMAINGPSATIAPQLRNLISQMASRAAGCGYCMAHTAHSASRAGIAAEKEEALWEYERSPLFSAAERAALRVAQGAAQVPNAVTDEDFAELKKILQRGADRRHRRGDRTIRLSQPLQRYYGDRARSIANRGRKALSRAEGLGRRQARGLTSREHRPTGRRPVRPHRPASLAGNLSAALRAPQADVP
jgi:AhpD family alkylhydroperoxidase